MTITFYSRAILCYSRFAYTYARQTLRRFSRKPLFRHRRIYSRFTHCTTANRYDAYYWHILDYSNIISVHAHRYLSRLRVTCITTIWILSNSCHFLLISLRPLFPITQDARSDFFFFFFIFVLRTSSGSLHKYRLQPRNPVQWRHLHGAKHLKLNTSPIYSYSNLAMCNGYWLFLSLIYL